MADGAALFLRPDHASSLSPIGLPGLRETAAVGALNDYRQRCDGQVREDVVETAKTVNRKKASRSEERGNCLSVLEIFYTAVVSGVKHFLNRHV
jgi:hypothetical protein